MNKIGECEGKARKRSAGAWVLNPGDQIIDVISRDAPCLGRLLSGVYPLILTGSYSVGPCYYILHELVMEMLVLEAHRPVIKRLTVPPL